MGTLFQFARTAVARNRKHALITCSYQMAPKRWWAKGGLKPPAWRPPCLTPSRPRATMADRGGGCHERAILAVSRVLPSRQARRCDLSVLRRDCQRRYRPDSNDRRAPLTRRALRGGRDHRMWG